MNLRRNLKRIVPAPHRPVVYVILRAMTTWSPTIEGFRTMFRRPALALAEVMWRWSFGGAACVLLGLGCIEYLNTLPVSDTDLLLLRTRHPLLISQAFSHILHGSALRVIFASIVIFSALAVLWIVLASFGREATLAPLVDYIRERARNFQAETASNSALPAIPEVGSEDPPEGSQMRSLAGLHFLRSVLALAACTGLVGAVIVASFASPKTSPHPGLVFIVAATTSLMVWLVWSSVSWFLSVASIFVMRQRKRTFGALSATVDLCRERFGAVMAVGTWFGLAHLVLFVVATSVVSFPLAFVRAVPPGVVLGAVLLLTLGYFAMVDTLYIGRLAGYVAILEAPPAPVSAPPLPPEPSTPQSGLSIQPETAMVDQDETILSDTPIVLDPPGSLQSGAPLAYEGALSDTAKTSQSEATLQGNADRMRTEN